MKIRCVIVDDEENKIENLQRELKQFSNLVVVKKYSDSKKFLKEQNLLQYDLAFLDVDMPAYTRGTEVAVLIHKPVVFVTSYRKEFSEELMKAQNKSQNILGFVSKASLTEELNEILPTITERIQKASGQVLFPCVGGSKFFHEKEIVAIATLPKGIEPRDKRLLKLSGGIAEWIIIKTMDLESIYERLDPKLFFILNRYCIVSKKFIESSRNKEEVLLKLPANAKGIEKCQKVGEKQWPLFKKWLTD